MYGKIKMFQTTTRKKGRFPIAIDVQALPPKGREDLDVLDLGRFEAGETLVRSGPSWHLLTAGN